MWEKQLLSRRLQWKYICRDGCVHRRHIRTPDTHNVSLQRSSVTITESVEQVNFLPQKLRSSVTAWKSGHSSIFWSSLKSSQMMMRRAICIPRLSWQSRSPEVYAWHFDGFQILSIVQWISDHLTIPIDDIDDDNNEFKDDLIELKASGSLSTQFSTIAKPLEIWASNYDAFANISKPDLMITLPCVTTCLYEVGFSAFVVMKTKLWAILDVGHDMAVVLSKTTPRIKRPWKNNSYIHLQCGMGDPYFWSPLIFYFKFLNKCVCSSVGIIRILHVGRMTGATPPLRHFSLTKTATTRTITAPVLDVFDPNWVPAAEDDRRSSILQMNTEGLTANKISVIEQLPTTTRHSSFVIQETHYATEDKLVIPNFSLAGSVLSRKHALATFVHKRLEWLLVDQSPEQSETEWCA